MTPAVAPLINPIQLVGERKRFTSPHQKTYKAVPKGGGFYCEMSARPALKRSPPTPIIPQIAMPLLLCGSPLSVQTLPSLRLCEDLQIHDCFIL